MRTHPDTHRGAAGHPEPRAQAPSPAPSDTRPASSAALPPAAAPGAPEAPRFQPLYQQIKAAILHGIEAGEWHAGEMIPSEVELARRFDVSQGTVRKAIEALAAEGLLSRRQGKGTYVTSHREPGAHYRFLRLRPDHGSATQPGSRIVDCRRVRAPADVARELGIRAGESVLFIRRLLTFADDPVVLDDIWLAGEEFRQLTADRLADHSGQLYAVIETELGTKMIHAREKLRAVCASEAQAGSLGVALGCPLLLVERVTSTFNGRPVELRRGLYRTDRHHYANEL